MTRLISAWRSLFAILLGAALFCGAAVANRGPIYFHDTFAYLRTASRGLEKVLHLPERIPEVRDTRTTPAGAIPSAATSSAAGEEGIKWSNRSFYYGLILAVADRLEAIWLVVGLQALLAAWVCFLLCRALVPDEVAGRRTRRVFLAAVAVTAAFTALPFYVAYLMPDLLFGLVLLAGPLIVLFPDRLTRAEWLGLAVMLVFACLSHGAAALLLLLAFTATAILARTVAQRRVPTVAALLVVLALSIGLAGNWVVNAAVQRVFGQAALWPPFLLARVVADGPGTLWLRERCTAGADLVLCSHLDALPTADADVFLWDMTPGIGVLLASDSATQRRIVAEQFTVVSGAVAAYPLLQLRASMRNFGRQLTLFGVEEFVHDLRLRAKVIKFYPSQLDEFDRTLLTRDAPDLNVLNPLHQTVVLGSLLLAAVLLGRRWEWEAGDPEGMGRRRRELALMLSLVAGVVLNAAISGVLSEPHSRYGARVVWVVPFAAAVLALWRLPLLRYGSADREAVASGNSDLAARRLSSQDP